MPVSALFSLPARPRSQAIPYPSGLDIGLANWLKHFATQLPHYQAHYQLTPLPIIQVQCLTLEFIDLLVHQMHAATASIWQRYQPDLAPRPEIVEQVAACKALLQASVNSLTVAIQQHPAYLATDGYALRLPMPTS